MAVLAAQDHAPRISFVIFLIELLPVIVSGEIQRVRVARQIAQLRKAHRAGDRAAVIQAMHLLRQLRRHHSQPARVRLSHIVQPLRQGLIRVVIAHHLAEQRGHIRIIGIIDLVSDAPQNHAGMVPVPPDHAGQILLMPLRKVLGIAEVLRRIDIMALPPFVFDALPLVERLVHDQKAQTVAQIQQVRIRRVMRRPDGIASHRLQLLQPDRPDFPGNSRPQASRVVMNAYALQLHIPPVQEKALIRVKPEDPDAEGKLLRVPDPAVPQGFAAQRIQVRILRAPELRPFHPQERLAGRARGFRLRHRLSPRVLQEKTNLLRLFRFIADPDFRLPAVRLQGHRRDPVLRKAGFIRQGQAHVPVNAAAGIPPGVRHVLVLRPQRDHVLPFPHKRGEIEGELRVSVGMLSEIIAVDPHPGVLIHALKGQPDPLFRFLLRQRKMLPVPAGSSRQIPGTAGPAGIKGMLHRPVMGQRHPAPRPVIIGHIEGVRRLPVVKEPLAVHIPVSGHSFRPPPFPPRPAES